MGKFDKDRHQKELAVRFCLARGMTPFLEVLVSSMADLSDSVEVLTDLDVVGVESVSDGELRRTIFDCKTASKMSSVNRAFWAAGVMQYSGSHHSYVILKNKAVHNHRMSALLMGVDLHNDASFIDLGRSLDPAFPEDVCYQSSLSRWGLVDESFQKLVWSRELLALVRNSVPLTKSPAAIFRRCIAELRSVRGEFDPGKELHVSLFLEVVVGVCVLWTSLARDARRLYEPTISREQFEKALRYHLWGGKESYLLRQQMRDRAAIDNQAVAAVELPAWDQLVAFVGLIISAPQSVFDCAHFCRELSFSLVCERDPKFDGRLSALVARNSRLKQFSVALADYLVAACGLPKDLARRVKDVVFAI